MADCSTLSARRMQNFAVRFMSVLLAHRYPVDAHNWGWHSDIFIWYAEFI